MEESTIYGVQIPQELRNLPCWVNWRYEKRRGKETKVPFDPKYPTKHASSTDPKTWGLYEDAYERKTARCGIGIVLQPPLIGIDLDHCVLDDGTLTFLAQEVLARFDCTYAEWSPSGKGVHLFVCGTLERAHKTRLGEIYTQGRYFTVTGLKLPAAPSSIAQGSADDIAWLCAKITPQAEVSQTTTFPRYHVPLDPADMAVVAPLVFSTLCDVEPLWRSTWERTRKLQGDDDDQSDSAYEMALARLAVLAGVDDQDIYKLLMQWRVVHKLAPKHHKALVLTIENAHKARGDDAQEKALNDPTALDIPDRFVIARKHTHLPIVRLVQMGRGEAHYRAHLSTGDVLDFGNYAGFKNADKWERYVWEYAGKHLFTEKKRWAKICRLLLTLCEVEETEEMSSAAETRAWLRDYLSELMHHPATVDTLRQSSPFVDESGQYVQLDAFRSYTRIHCQAPPITRSAMMGRLRVLGWAEVKLTRSDDKRTITRNYWHKAPELDPTP